jgi:hypothetical protein
MTTEANLDFRFRYVRAHEGIAAIFGHRNPISPPIAWSSVL